MGREKMIHNEFYALGSEKLAELVVVDTGTKRTISSMSMLLAAAIEVLKEFSQYAIPSKRKRLKMRNISLSYIRLLGLKFSLLCRTSFNYGIGTHEPST